MQLTREQEVIVNLSAAVRRCLRTKNFSVSHLARECKESERALRELIAATLVPIQSYGHLCTELLRVGRRYKGLWDPLTWRLLMTARDFKDRFQ